MRRAVLRCSACRYSLLDSFAALAGVSIPSQACQPFQTRAHASQSQVRSYASTFSLRQFAVSQSSTTSEESHNDAAQPSPAPESASLSPASADSTPWYLQVSTPAPPASASPLLTLQEIPPLPENPPTILEPLLQHLSVRIGLDNLSLIDLRSLHPPPALGANLLMIIGTARSTKHLNVSADRLCRWLRTDWGLRPYADGLLGRNELKLKLRRKARRQKMMGLVGGREVMSDDDGITTGWVCVNVGVVDEDLQPRERAEEGDGTEVDPDVVDEEVLKAQERPVEGEDEYTNPPPESFEAQQRQTQNQSEVAEPEVDGGFTGFGSRSTSPRIVVQMFTEPKRLEMDLEGLWDWRNTRKSSKSERRDAEVEEDLKMRGLALEDNEEGATIKRMNETWEDDEDDGREVQRNPKSEKGKKIKQQMERSIFDD